MTTLNSNNLNQFNLIDEIHGGYIELNSSKKLQEQLKKSGGSVNLEPVMKMNFCARENLVVKCQNTGNLFKVVL